MGIKGLHRESKKVIKKLHLVGIEPGTSAILIWCSPTWASLALIVTLRLLESLFCPTLLILAKSLQSKSQLYQQDSS